MSRRLIEQFHREIPPENDGISQDMAAFSSEASRQFVRGQIPAVVEYFAKPELVFAAPQEKEVLENLLQKLKVGELPATNTHMVAKYLQRVCETQHIAYIYGMGVAFGVAMYCAGEQTPRRLMAISKWLKKQQQPFGNGLPNTERLTVEQYQESIEAAFQYFATELEIDDGDDDLSIT